MYGTELQALPEVEVDTDQMTATFSIDADLEAGPPRSKSDLELKGEAIDAQLGQLIDQLINKLVAKEILRPRYTGSGTGWHHHFPKSTTESWNKATGKGWTFREMLKDAIEKRSLDHFFHAYITVDIGSKIYPDYKTHHPHSVLVKLEFGPRHWVRTGEDHNDRIHSVIRVWLKKNGEKVLSETDIQDLGGEDRYYYQRGLRVPFQVGVGTSEYLMRPQPEEEGLGFFGRVASRIKKGWDPIATGGINFARVGRRLNRVFFGETTKAEYEMRLHGWLAANGHHDYDTTKMPAVEVSVIREAQKALGDWVLNFLEALPVEHVLHLQWEVCDTCNGKGSHVNPSIDAHGLSSEDFDEDPEFREEYFSGTYDVPCYECGGRTTSLHINRKRTSEAALKAADECLKDHDSYVRESEAERRMGA